MKQTTTSTQNTEESRNSDDTYDASDDEDYDNEEDGYLTDTTSSYDCLQERYRTAASSQHSSLIEIVHVGQTQPTVVPGLYGDSCGSSEKRRKLNNERDGTVSPSTNSSSNSNGNCYGAQYEELDHVKSNLRSLAQSCGGRDVNVSLPQEFGSNPFLSDWQDQRLDQGQMEELDHNLIEELCRVTNPMYQTGSAEGYNYASKDGRIPPRLDNALEKQRAESKNDNEDLMVQKMLEQITDAQSFSKQQDTAEKTEDSSPFQETASATTFRQILEPTDKPRYVCLDLIHSLVPREPLILLFHIGNSQFNFLFFIPIADW